MISTFCTEVISTYSTTPSEQFCPWTNPEKNYGASKGLILVLKYGKNSLGTSRALPPGPHLKLGLWTLSARGFTASHSNVKSLSIFWHPGLYSQTAKKKKRKKKFLCPVQNIHLVLFCVNEKRKTNCSSTTIPHIKTSVCALGHCCVHHRMASTSSSPAKRTGTV